ncbi:hypothetical protein GCM10028809_59570 [Spirosoma gilvum]
MAVKSISFTSSEEATDVVNQIMRYTGLPQNFEVIEANVPNAAAVILLGQDSLPHRVIAYNKDFMNLVRQATQANNWAPISVLAHEIGHHLCGHTIMPGGSQPPTELEADKFSGYVLYKMGALLADAQKAIQTLVPDQDSQTHPARSKRLLAIEEGWKQACSQQSLECNGLVAAKPMETKLPASGPTPTDSSTTEGRLEPGVGNPKNQVATIPTVSTESIPTKFDRFVIDELGGMHPDVKKRLSANLFKFANEKNVEIVVLVAKDLQGLSADAFAFRMLRQLRIGKLEVGNGACLVIAPNQREVGVGLLPGLQVEVDENMVNSIKNSLTWFVDHYKEYPQNPSASEFIELACRRITDASKHWDWVIRFQSLIQMQQVYDEQFEKDSQRSNGVDRDPMQSLTWRKLVRTTGVLTSTNGIKHSKFNIPSAIPAGGRQMEIKTEDGRYAVLYVTKGIEDIMPVKLEENKRYSFVLRETAFHSLEFQLISYDLLE